MLELFGLPKSSSAIKVETDGGRWREVASELLGDDHAAAARRERARERVSADSDIVEVRVDDVAEVAAGLDEQQVNRRYVGRAAAEAKVLTDGRETVLGTEDVAEGGAMTEPTGNSGIFVRSKRVVPALSRRLSERVHAQWVQSAEGTGLVDKAEQLRTYLAESRLRLLADERLVVGNEVLLGTSDRRAKRR